MKPYSYINNALRELHPNEDSVLQEFYQQRKKRSNHSTKRHSLLQKNSSYFSNSNYLNQSIGTCKTPENTGKAQLFTSNKNQAQHISATLPVQKRMSNEKDMFASIKDQIKDRNRSANEFQIMNKYKNFDKQNFISTFRFSSEDAYPKGGKQAPLSSKNCERKISLVEMQNSFKALTGSEVSHLKHSQNKNVKIQVAEIDMSNFRDKFKKRMQVANLNNEEKKLQKSGVTPAYEENENIKIVNKVRSHSTKEKNKQDFIRVKQIIQKYEDEDPDEPLLVLAQRCQMNSHSSSLNHNQQASDQTSEPKINTLENSPAENIENLRSSSFCVESPSFKFAGDNFTYEDKLEKSRDRKEFSKSRKQQMKASSHLSNSRQGNKHEFLDKVVSLRRQYNSNLHEGNAQPNEKLVKADNQVEIGKKEAQNQLMELRKKLESLEKQNKKQAKFIESVQTMRKVIEKTDAACNLKQLWRWVKTLPNKY